MSATTADERVAAWGSLHPDDRADIVAAVRQANSICPGATITTLAGGGAVLDDGSTVGWFADWRAAAREADARGISWSFAKAESSKPK